VDNGDQVLVEDLLFFVATARIAGRSGPISSCDSALSQFREAIFEAVTPVRAVNTTRLSQKPTSSGRMIS